MDLDTRHRTDLAGRLLCDRRPFVAETVEAEERDAFDARVAKVVAAVRERRYGFDPAKAS